MTDYLIGFRGGECLALKVKDGVEFVKSIVEVLDDNPAVPVQWLHMPGVLLNLSEITYVVPRTATAE